MENVELVVVVPLVGERGKEEGGGGSENLKTVQTFNQHALIKIWDLKYYPILNSLTLKLLTQIYIWPWLLSDTGNQGLIWWISLYVLTDKERLVSELTRSDSWGLNTNWNSLCVYNGGR